MQDIEPFFNWRELYIASEDERSPFYEREYSEFVYTNTIYNFYIHPQWDEFGSNTLYMKVLFADYEQHFAVIEFIGEWNDCLHNDIMFFLDGEFYGISCSLGTQIIHAGFQSLFPGMKVH